MGITRNSGNLSESHQFLDIVLEPESQLASARAIGQAAVTSHANFPADLDARVGFSDEERANFIPLDHDYAIEQGSAMLNWWEQEFKG
jgi:putative spermidine/putrescine transport system substrate-binding protein